MTTQIRITASDGYAYLSTLRAAKQAYDEGNRELGDQLLAHADEIADRFKVVHAPPVTVPTWRDRLRGRLHALVDRL
jgi:hypothetical protein